MLVKTNTLKDRQLDWAVAKVINYEVSTEGFYSYELKRAVVTKLHGEQVPGRTTANTEWAPSTDWSQGGPILSSERISRTIDHSGVWIAYWTSGYVEGDEGKLHMQGDNSELVAGLRCVVALKLGKEVEIPEELL